MTPIKSSIVLQQLELHVQLGWLPAERLTLQLILVDIHIDFTKPPDACLTDDLQDTYCYHTLYNTLQENIAPKTYRLIEHLGYDIYHFVKSVMTDDSKVNICVTKNLKALNLSGAACFWYGDGGISAENKPKGPI